MEQNQFLSLFLIKKKKKQKGKKNVEKELVKEIDIKEINLVQEGMLV